jgi:hypothetical protein
MEVSSQIHASANLTAGKKPTGIEYETGWAPDPVWMFSKRKLSCPGQDAGPYYWQF